MSRTTVLQKKSITLFTTHYRKAHIYHTVQGTFIPHSTGHIYTTQYRAHLYHTVQDTSIPHSTGHIYTTQYRAHLYHIVQDTSIPHSTGHIYTTQYRTHRVVLHIFTYGLKLGQWGMLICVTSIDNVYTRQSILLMVCCVLYYCRHIVEVLKQQLMFSICL